MAGRPIAAVAAAVVCLVAAGSAGGADGARSTIARQDAKATSNARNLTSEVETCFADTMDYGRCRSAAVLNQGMGEFAVPIGSGPGQARVAKATRGTYTIDSYSRSGNHFLMVRSSSGLLSRKCTRRGRGLCRSSGSW
jgi:type IV pilus assembly protein PilA